MIEAGRRNVLIELAADLATRLASVSVPRLASERSVEAGSSIGIPQACLGVLLRSIRNCTSAPEIRTQLERLATLDRIGPQNINRPAAHYATLGAVILRLLDEVQLGDVEEILYVVAWSRRLLPRDESSSDLDQSSLSRKGSAAPWAARRSGHTNMAENRPQESEKKPRVKAVPKKEVVVHRVEWVTMTDRKTARKSMVAMGDGSEIPCTNIQTYGGPAVGDRFRAEVTYVNGVATSAVYKALR